MKIIFLDFFGVMDGYPGERFDKFDTVLSPTCGKLIEDLCNKIDAKIVITSDAVWNAHLNIGKTQEAVEDLMECGVSKDNIIGYTVQRTSSRSLYTRPQEIQDWLEDFSERYKQVLYVIFDDLPLSFPTKMKERFIKIDNGLEEKHILQAQKLFGESNG